MRVEPLECRRSLTLKRALKDEEGLSRKCYRLLVCDNPLTGQRKYFLSNAPANTPLKDLLRVAFSRWPIERCFQEQKGEVGLTGWEGRTWLGLQRHLILTAVSHLFLVIGCQRLRGKKSGGDVVPGSSGRRRGGAIVVAYPGSGREAIPAYCENVFPVFLPSEHQTYSGVAE